jgi:arginine/ornithine permease
MPAQTVLDSLSKEQQQEKESLNLFYSTQTVIKHALSKSASQLAFRRKYLRQGGKVEDLKFKTPLYPLLPGLALVLNSTVLISLAFDAEQRVALYCGVPFMIACYVIYYFKIKKKQQSAVQKQEVQLNSNKKMVI